jgi:hypothetical protein
MFTPYQHCELEYIRYVISIVAHRESFRTTKEPKYSITQQHLYSVAEKFGIIHVPDFIVIEDQPTTL